MKKILNTILIALCILGFSSCEDFMDIHKKYIEGGEIIYAPKPDTLFFVAGKERIQFNCHTYNAPNVKSVDVYWNDGLDSLIIPVTLGSGYDSISVILDNMQEKSYTFTVRTTDNFGHKSLYLTNFGASYGASYQATLNDRRIKNVSLSDKGGTINWYSAPEGLVRNEIRYIRKDGIQAIVSMDSEAYTTFCPDAKTGTSFEYRSLYIPEEQAIDTFATVWSTHDEAFPTQYQYGTEGWSALACSDETASDGGGIASLIDGDLNTYWHSQWEGGDAPLPHWVVIDMASSKKISGLEVFRRAGNKDAKTIQFFVNDNPDAANGGWAKIAEGVFEDADGLSISVPESVNTSKGRYLKIVLPDSNREPYISLAEVRVYGR